MGPYPAPRPGVAVVPQESGTVFKYRARVQAVCTSSRAKCSQFNRHSSSYALGAEEYYKKDISQRIAPSKALCKRTHLGLVAYLDFGITRPGRGTVQSDRARQCFSARDAMTWADVFGQPAAR